MVITFDLALEPIITPPTFPGDTLEALVPLAIILFRSCTFEGSLSRASGDTVGVLFTGSPVFGGSDEIIAFGLLGVVGAAVGFLGGVSSSRDSTLPEISPASSSKSSMLFGMSSISSSME